MLLKFSQGQDFAPSQQQQQQTPAQVPPQSQTPNSQNQNFGPANIPQAVDREKIYQWISELSNTMTRENALLELS